MKKNALHDVAPVPSRKSNASSSFRFSSFLVRFIPIRRFTQPNTIIREKVIRRRPFLNSNHLFTGHLNLDALSHLDDVGLFQNKNIQFYVLYQITRIATSLNEDMYTGCFFMLPYDI